MAGRVLVCEDSAILGTLLADALRAHGVAGVVEHFKDGASFLSAYRLYAQAKDTPALVTLDIELSPGTPDGLLVGRALRALEKQLGTPAAPILFFSSQSSSDAIQAAVRDCFPARFAQKKIEGGPASVAYEGALLMRSMLAPPPSTRAPEADSLRLDDDDP
jgi:CheY-like chemotaxis protein